MVNLDALLLLLRQQQQDHRARGEICQALGVTSAIELIEKSVSPPVSGEAAAAG